VKNPVTTLFDRILLIGIALVLLFLMISIIQLPHFVFPDVAMYSEMGQKVLDGQRPYVDYEEINFPMIHVLNVVPALLNRMTGIPTTITLQICFVVLLLGTLWLLWRLLTAYGNKSIALVSIFAVAVLSWTWFITFLWGQREHIFIMLYLPWLVLRLMRREDKSVGRGLALTIGLMAGVGFALIPYFSLTGLLVEGVGLLTSRRWHIRTLEVLGVLIVAGAHALYFALNPDVLRAFIVLIQRLTVGYPAYLAGPWDVGVLLSNFTLSVIPFVLLGLRYKSRVVPLRLLLALGMMGIGSLIGFLLQQKGWMYHGVPFITSTLLLSLLFGTEILLGYVQPKEKRRENFIRLVMLAVSISLAFGIVMFEINGMKGAMNATEELRLFALNPYIETYTNPQDRVMFVDTILNPAYPMLTALNRRSASRYAAVQAFPMSYYRYEGLPYTDPAHVVPAYMQEYLDAFPVDMAIYKPKLVIFRSDECGVCRGDYSNLYDYLVARGVIDATITPDYTLVAVDEGYHIYVRNDLVPQP